MKTSSLLTAVVALLLTLSFTSCRTVRGVGQDVQSIGSTIQRAVP